MPRKINLLFHIRSMEMGGVQKVLLQYLNHLPREIFEISLMVKLFQGELVNEIPAHIKTIAIGKGKQTFSKNPWVFKIQLILRRFHLFLHQIFPFLGYKKLAQKPDIEIGFDTSSFRTLADSPIATSKKVGWLHIDLKNTHSNERTNHQIIDLMKKFDANIIVSDYAKQSLKNNYNVDLANTFVINNPVSYAEINAQANAQKMELKQPCFIASGRISNSKGHFILAKIHKKLLDNGLSHYIYILGDGPQKQRLIHKIKELGVEKSFILLGNQNNPYPYIKAADFFIHPSQRESYPMVILESMMLHKPIISTNVGGIPEMIDDNVDGILVNYNEDEIFEAMKKFLTDPDFVEKIKQGTHDADKKFDEQKIYKQVAEVFENVMMR